ncbi:septal ring lytic transglycosylase RlpA family protein [Hydrogenophaga sp. H7]|uniref:septal ring lytic transglycosylase RlpA family protein n=1 Tax=Hydrogenophaga sp. H7 TaxID=1882399 RepID=UPI00269FACB1|nr:septal ring lytic transglycosylase RlpA family protein [Hydrogenophaga sp. H7]
MKRCARFFAPSLLMAVLAGCATPLAGPVPAGAATDPLPVVPHGPAIPPTRNGDTLADPTGSAAAERSADGARSPDGSRDSAGVLEKGLASWYGSKFHGRRTASGERYDRHAMTAAHRTLPFGTRVRVRSVVTGKEVVVRINDRGPFKRSRVIDLSQAAFNALGLQGRGVTQVELLPE